MGLMKTIYLLLEHKNQVLMVRFAAVLFFEDLSLVSGSLFLKAQSVSSPADLPVL